MTALRCSALGLLVVAASGWFALRARAEDVKEAKTAEAAYETHTPQEWRAIVQELIEMLESRGPLKVAEATRRLAQIQDPNAAGALHPGLQLKDPAQRRLFLAPLVRIGGPLVAQNIANWSLADGEVGREMEAALIGMKDKAAALPLLAHSLLDKDRKVRASQVLAAADLVSGVNLTATLDFADGAPVNTPQTTTAGIHLDVGWVATNNIAWERNLNMQITFSGGTVMWIAGGPQGPIVVNGITSDGWNYFETSSANLGTGATGSFGISPDIFWDFVSVGTRRSRKRRAASQEGSLRGPPAWLAWCD